jgi:enoyl-CoA hydratase/carnithine racemase
MSKEVMKRIQAIAMSKPNNNIIVRKNGSMLEVVLNRPNRSNAFSLDMYLKVAEAIR